MRQTLKTFTFSVLLAASLAGPALAQEQEGRSEISASFLGAFPSGSASNGVNQGGSGSGGVLANYRFLFTAHQGVELDYGFTRDTQQYQTLIGPAGVHNDMHEVSASYVFRVPLGRVTPFVSAGVGGVVFNPLLSGTFTPAVPDTQARAAFVYAVGMDLAISNHLRLRPQYRALVFKAPDFGIGIGSDSGMYFSELACGLVWKL